MTAVATVATYSAEVRGERYCGLIAQTDGREWHGCIFGDDTAGQLAALQPIAWTYESCVVRTNSAEIVSAFARFRETGGAIMDDIDVSVSRLIAECDLRPVLQAEADVMRRDAARVLLRGTFVHESARYYALGELARCKNPRERAAKILARVNRQALADALGVGVRLVHSWARRGVGLRYVEAVAALFGLPANLVR